MKISSKYIISAALIALFSAPVFCADIVEDDTPAPAPAKKAQAAVPSAAAAPAAAAAESTPAAARPHKKPEVSASDIADIRQKLEDLNAAVKELRDNVKSLEEKNIEAGNVAADLDACKKQLDALQTSTGDDRKKIDDLSGQFSDISDTIKDRIDKMQSWDDIMDVLKKEISNNEREIARLRKDIEGLKNQYGREDNVFSTVMQWPYAGITALGVSLLAFIVVMVKK